MDSAGRVPQKEYHATLDARDRREAEYRERIVKLEAERDATWRRLAAAMNEASVGSYSQVIDLAESALKHWHKIVTNPDLQKHI